MEMRDLGNESTGDANDRIAAPGARQALERTDYAALVGRPEADQRVALYTRLRNIIDNATKSIRALKAENTTLAAENGEMSGRIGVLEQRIRALTTDLANDEMALRQSAETLEQVLKGAAIAAPTQQPAERPTPISANEREAPRAEMAAAAMPSAEAPEPETAEGAMPEAGAPEVRMRPSEQPATETPLDQPPVGESAAPDMAPPPEVPANYAAEAGAAPEPVAPPAVRADGSYTLIAYPFVRFSDLGQFQAALQKMAGVHDVQVRRFAQGTLEMRIGYTGTTDLATTLRDSAADVEDVTEEEPYRLRVRLRTNQDA